MIDPIDPRAHASPHFTFGELIVTEHRDFIDEQADAPAQVRQNLAHLAVDLLEPMRVLCGRLRVNSGYRCPGLNAAIGGARKSAHVDGLAADVFPLELSLAEAFDRMARTQLPWDQLILEYGRWIHIAAARHAHAPRREALMIFTAGRYEPYSAEDSRVRRLA